MFCPGGTVNTPRRDEKKSDSFRMNIIHQDDVPRKLCIGPCKRILSATIEVFGKDKYTKDGLNLYCKECKRAAWHAKYPDAKPYKKPLTTLQKEEICQRYVAGESAHALAKAFGADKANVRLMMIKRGVTMRENTPDLHRIYQCNHAYFDQPLDEERAYWIGFLLADGCVSYRKGTKANNAPVLAVSLSEVDTHHIERFREALESNHPITHFVAKSGYGAGKTMAYFVIRSHELVNGAEKHGIVQRKTKFCPTPNLPPELMRHMYRGYVDGDGGLSLTDRDDGKVNAALDIVGTEQFLKDFASWLANHAGFNHKDPLKSHNTTVVMNLRYGGIQQVSSILHFLYDDATVYLDRKFATAQSIWSTAVRQQLKHRRPQNTHTTSLSPIQLSIWE